MFYIICTHSCMIHGPMNKLLMQRLHVKLTFPVHSRQEFLNMWYDIADPIRWLGSGNGNCRGRRPYEVWSTPALLEGKVTFAMLYTKFWLERNLFPLYITSWITSKWGKATSLKEYFWKITLSMLCFLAETCTKESEIYQCCKGKHQR